MVKISLNGELVVPDSPKTAEAVKHNVIDTPNMCSTVTLEVPEDRVNTKYEFLLEGKDIDACHVVIYNTQDQLCLNCLRDIIYDKDKIYITCCFGSAGKYRIVFITSATTRVQKLTKERIREIALQSGFTEREQPNGTIALNDYVFKFVDDIFNELGLD